MRFRAVLISAALVAQALVVPLVVAGPVAAEPPDPLPEPVWTPEALAQQEAIATDSPVPVEGRTDERTEVLANPDGTFTVRESVRPVRVRQGDQWVAVDTTLELVDGAVRPVAVPVGLSLSDGGTEPLATLEHDGRSITLSWPEPLPVPTLDGDTATYPEVFPGVDLAVTATSEGFSEVFVVKTREAAENPELVEFSYDIAATGVSLTQDAAGNISATDDVGEVVFHAPSPQMWDSSGMEEPGDDPAGPPTGAETAPVGVELGSGDLTLTPDQGMLDDPATEYPVYLDPNFTATFSAWTSVWQKFPNNSYFNSGSLARVGHEDEEGNTNRSYFQFDTRGLLGKQIISATFQIRETWAWSCQPRPVQLWITGAIGPGTTWNHQPARFGLLDSRNVAHGRDPGCPDHGVDFNATSGVRQIVAQRKPGITVGLFAADEFDTFGWKKFLVSHSAHSPELEVEYNTPPHRPTGMTSAPSAFPDVCRGGAARPFIGDASPQLWAKVTDPDRGLLRAQFQWEHTHGAPVGTFTSDPWPSGTWMPADIGGGFTDGSNISWRVRTIDAAGAPSAWSHWCEYTVDTQAPDQVPVVSSTDYPAEQWGGSEGAAGTFVLDPNGVTDVASYRYGFTNPPTHTVAAWTDGSASVTLTPLTWGPMALYVQSQDRVGKLSPLQTYEFNVNPPTPPVGHWDFNEGSGEVVDDAEGDRPATLTGDWTWSDGRHGEGVTFDGATGYAATDGPVVDTSQSFSVAAWVRIDDGSVVSTAVSQIGTWASAFYLQYFPTLGWRFALTPADVNQHSVNAVHIRATLKAVP